MTLARGYYKRVVIPPGKLVVTTAKIVDFIETLEGRTDEDKRINLPILKKRYLQSCVDYVEDNLPPGLARVDGYVTEPILVAQCDIKIAALPEPAEE